MAPPQDTSAANVQQDADSASGGESAAHSSEVATREVTGPDWDHVPFDVGCARCGHDLRGLTEPACPQCKLEFDWADAVPIEELVCGQCEYHLYGLTKTRCPECGTAFVWQEALATHHRKKNPLFEYQWRKRPIRSLLDTWRRTLRPRKFWQSVSIHDPPRAWALVLHVIAGCLLLAIMLTLVVSLAFWVVFSFKQAVTSQRTHAWAFQPDFGALPPYLLNGIVMFIVNLVFLKLLLCWLLTSFLSLFVFPQSMRACKVRFSQVIRIWAYAVPRFMPLVIAITFAARCLERSGVFRRIGLELILGAVLCAVFFAIWSLRCGYRYYLKMPHSAAIAIASQVMAILAAGALEILISPNIPSTLFYRLVESLHVF